MEENDTIVSSENTNKTETPPKKTETPQQKIQRLISDVSSPYFIHSADHPRTPLVEIPLSGNNYLSWKRSVKMVLFAKNKLGFIDGSLPIPEDPDIEPLWKRVSIMILSWLLNSISNTLVPSLAGCQTPRQLWIELESRFNQGNNVSTFQLQKTIANFRQEGRNITEFYNTFIGYWTELDTINPLPPCTCGTGKAWNDHLNNERVYQFLMGVNDEFQVLRTQIIAMDTIPSLSKVFGLLHSEEKQNNIHHVAADNNTALATFKSQFGKNSGKMGSSYKNINLPIKNVPFQQSEINRQAPNYGQDNFSKLNSVSTPYQSQNNSSKGAKNSNAYCTHCHRNGHNRTGCFKLIGYPEWWPGRQINTNTQGPVTRAHAAYTEPKAETGSTYLSVSEASQANLLFGDHSALYSGPDIEEDDWSW